jgi:VacB/RNase II family 3'-5' exoribonuclease
MPHDLLALARQALESQGFSATWPPVVQTQLDALTWPAIDSDVRDLRHLPWSSIDNDTSRDLDQIEHAERRPDGRTLVRVGIADVDAFVPRGTPIDARAAESTTSVYAGITVFSMLPETLSTGLTSLLGEQDRLVMVTEFTVDRAGRTADASVYRALARNHAQLTYSAVGRWLDGAGPLAVTPVIAEQLRWQEEAACALRQARVTRGALSFERMETDVVVENGQVTGISAHRRNRASLLIEDFMLAANETMAITLRDRHVSSLRRVVRAPERWDRIVAIAAERGARLPATPDPAALSEFLQQQRERDAVHFNELSLSVMKLLGPGEYALELPGDNVPDHFSLAAQHYAHSTAPNRRFADVVTQRIVKAALVGAPAPYTNDELATIALQCTRREDAARKVERVMEKRLAAVAMAGRMGETFDAVVTGVKPKGVFVRVCDPPLEGKLENVARAWDVGDAIRVRLRGVDVPAGFIDFVPVS